MSRLLVRLVFVSTVALLGAGSVGFARASIVAIGDLAYGPFAPSAIPALLGPINELGRNGWQCRPEQAVQATKASSAALPAAGSVASGRP